jgi:predicted dehydrogenase
VTAPRLRACVIGAGAISREHLTFLRDSDRAELAGVCDLSRAAARHAAERYGAAGFYADLGAMLEAARPDVVHVLTPPHTHVDVVAKCLESGSHVICEKPIAPTNAEFRRLWEIARRHGRYLIEDQNYRFNETVTRIAALVEQGALGEIRDVEVYFALGIRESGWPYSDENLPSPLHGLPAGALHDFTTHMCYLALMFVPQVDRVTSVWSNLGGGTLFKYDDLDALAVNGKAHVRLRFNASTRPAAFRLTVRGTRGYAETELLEPYVREEFPRAGGAAFSPLVNHLVNGCGLIRAAARNFHRKLVQKTAYEGIPLLLDRAYAAMATGEPPPVRFEDMDGPSRLVDALLAGENRA